MRRGVFGFEDMLQDYLVYFILLVVFVGGMVTFAIAKGDAGGHWEDVYADLLVHTIARAQPGDVIRLDFTRPAELAVRAGVSFSSLVQIVPEKQQVCTQFGKGETCRTYFRNTKVIVKEPVSEEPGPKELVLEVVR